MCLSYRELKNTGVRIRRQRMCAWCAETIYAKQMAQYRVYVFDSELISDWMHPECYQAMQASPTEAYCDGFMPGDFERGVSVTTQEVQR